MSGRLRIIAAAAIGAAWMMTAGCASLDELNKAKAAAARANEELTKVSAELTGVRMQNDQLRQELAARDAQLATKDKLLASLQDENGKLGERFADLKKLYDELAGREVGVGPLPAALNQKLIELARANPDLMEYFPELGMVKLKADLTFDPGSTDIKSGAVTALKKLADILGGPEAASFYIYVAGHTDDIPLSKSGTVEKHASNWGLSVHRSLAVIKTLFEAGVAQQRMGALGFSMYHPVAPNAPSRKGNALNRRVELWIVPEGKFLTTTKVEAPKSE